MEMEHVVQFWLHGIQMLLSMMEDGGQVGVQVLLNRA